MEQGERGATLGSFFRVISLAISNIGAFHEISVEISIYQRNPQYIGELNIISAEPTVYQRFKLYIGEINNISAFLQVLSM